jgi:hypothetical protein
MILNHSQHQITSFEISSKIFIARENYADSWTIPSNQNASYAP